MSLIKKIVVSAYACFHLMAIVWWNMPPSYLTGKIQQFVSPYMRFLGIWQGWHMFAPTPLRVNLYHKARVIYRDGTFSDYDFPRVSQMHYLKRYVKYHYHKIGENINQEVMYPYIPDVARYLAKRYMLNLSNPPVRVDFYRYWWEVPPPGQGLGKRPTMNFTENLFYVYPVSHGDLVR